MRTMTSSEVRDRIVVGVDGSPSSVEALRWALEQAELTGARIEVVTAWEPQAAYWWAMPVIDEGAEALAQRMQADCMRQVLHAVPPRVELDQFVTQGPPAKVLMKAAEGARLLVLGTRGHRPLVEAMLGSVGQQCVHEARCPVVIMPAEAQSEEEPEGA
jgi:nucleotide-binding universal stress UspA family protein